VASGVLGMTEIPSSRWSRVTRVDRGDLAARAYKQPNPGMLAEVAAGLSAPQKELSPKYLLPDANRARHTRGLDAVPDRRAGYESPGRAGCG